MQMANLSLVNTALLGASFYENFQPHRSIYYMQHSRYSMVRTVELLVESAHLIVLAASSGARMKASLLSIYGASYLSQHGVVLFSSNRCWPQVSLASCLSEAGCGAEIDKCLWRPVPKVVFSSGLGLNCYVFREEMEKTSVPVAEY